MSNLLNIMLSSKDPVVKAAQVNQLDREGQWTRKSSTAVQCQEILDSIQEECFIPNEHNTYNLETAIRLELPKIKTAAKNKIKEHVLNKAKEASSKLVVQGEFARTVEEENSEIDWKSVIYQVPKGVMAFACRAATNTLASPDNLARWGRIVESRCKLCTASPCTLGHLLSNCSVALNQERYNFRHDSILNYLLSVFSASQLEGLEFYSDLKGWRSNGGSIPASIMTTEQRPDMVILDRRSSPTTIHMIELTVPFDTVTGFKKSSREERT